MLNRVSSFLLLGLLLGGAVSADDVFLKNGRKFEGVIAEVTDSQVRIRMQGGVISLPKSQVLRVDEKDSDLSGYLLRKEALRRKAAASAQDWLELARWAKSQGLEQATREAALAAAELDPKLEGLAPILRSFRYTYDEQLGRWLSYDESMRRRGFVFVSGVWVSREELAERDRQREQEITRRRADAEAARAERAARQTELLLATQTALLEETVRERWHGQGQGPYLYTPSYGWPVVVIPGYFPPRPPHHCPQGDCGPSPGSGGNGPEPPSHPHPPSHGGFIRIPGSLIPGDRP
jgi:hypothetical protein